MHHNLFKQSNNTSAVQQIVHLINSIFRNISVIFIPAGTRNAKVEHLHHRNPKAMLLCHLLSGTLLGIEVAHICLANSTLRFIY